MRRRYWQPARGGGMGEGGDGRGGWETGCTCILIISDAMDAMPSQMRLNWWVATIKTGHLRKVHKVLFYENVLYVQ